ncbi:Membrane-associated protein VIPP1 [Hibiscus syriacus]|uniref:Membrane-associated protein VIPP1 n=1 Tax=Hibiscus syriacus TaxID=106335 RepID=A0A6A2ZM52_HIBSY|nr:Membrane-associated protein VIPP1 [Hibiscus syriacus]
MAVKSHIITGLTVPLKPTAAAAAASSSGTRRSLCLVKKQLTSTFFNGGALFFDGLSSRKEVAKECHSSYANALVSSFEDPEKILDQAVIEMNDDLVKMRQATAQVLASQKRLENKYKAAQQASEDWYRKAQLALQKGEEDLAREALKRRKSFAVRCHLARKLTSEHSL